MKRNLLVAISLMALLGIFFLIFNNLKANAQVKNRPSANSSNSNQKIQSNASNRASNTYAGNAFISNTGQFIDLPKASGSEITPIDEAGVSVIFPKGYEIYDVAKMYSYEAEDANRSFDTRAHIHSLDTDWGIDIVICTSHNLTFEQSLAKSRELIGGDRGFKVLKSGVKSTINGFDLVSSNGIKGNQTWTMDAFKTSKGALIVVAIGFPQEMKKNQTAIQKLLQSIKLK